MFPRIILLMVFAAFVLSCGATSGPTIANEADRPALILIDLQRDFLREDGAKPIANSHVAPVIQTANDASDHARGQAMAVVWVGNAFSKNDLIGNWARDNAAVEGTRGAEFDHRVVRAKLEPTFEKSQPDAFSNEALDWYLREQNVGHIYITGVHADQGVLMTVKGARNRGYTVSVIREGLGAESNEDLKDVVEAYRGVGADVISYQDFLAATPDGD